MVAIEPRLGETADWCVAPTPRLPRAASQKHAPMSDQSVPTYDQFIEPLLRVLADHPGGLASSAAYEAVSNRVGLTPEQRQALIPSGHQATYKNRIGWAHDSLKRARISHCPRRALWCLTDVGRQYAAQHPQLSREQIKELGRYEGRRATEQVQDTEPSDPAVQATTASPDDRLSSALAEIRSSVGAELLELTLSNSPEFFEQLVLDLLHAMGYGNARKDLQRVGRSGDGGIDGVLPLDPLGLEKVYIQAKRYKGSVGRPEVQGFYGALAGQRAKKGVMITTSTFTSGAVEFVASVEGIVLINGEQLTELMMDHGVGTSHTRVIRVPEIDSDYFDG